MNESLDDLRRAARNFAAAETQYNALVSAKTKATLAAASRALVTAGDVHAARKSEGIADLIRSGHTFESAKRVMEMRSNGDRKARAKPKAKIAPKKKWVFRGKRKAKR